LNLIYKLDIFSYIIYMILRKYQTGDKLVNPEEEVITKQPIKVYPGSPGWEDSLKYKKALERHKESQDSSAYYSGPDSPFRSASGGFGSMKTLTLDDFLKQNPKVNIPEGATAVNKYSRNIQFNGTGSDYTPHESVQMRSKSGERLPKDSMYSTYPESKVGVQNGYTFVYPKPEEAHYEVIEDPEIALANDKWGAYKKKYSGSKKETHKYPDAFGSYESDTPWDNSRGPMPTSGAWKSYGESPSAPKDFKYPPSFNKNYKAKATATLRRGGKIMHTAPVRGLLYKK